LIRSTR